MNNDIKAQLIERYMMLYFEAKIRRDSNTERGNMIVATYWSGNLRGIELCIMEVSKEPMFVLEDRYSYLL